MNTTEKAIQVLVPIANGSEEIEAVTIINVLRRAGIHVCVASAEVEPGPIRGARGIHLQADAQLNDVLKQDWAMIALPGGMPGAQRLSEHAGLTKRLEQQLHDGKWVAAICAAPAVILGRQDLIPQATATCYPSFQKALAEHIEEVSEKPLVVDQHLITAQGPATAMQFALTLVEVLTSKIQAEDVANALLFIAEGSSDKSRQR
jgi:protein deglycase